jgi:nitrogen fixation NifU-like protein
MSGAPSPGPGPGRIEELYQSVILDHNRRPRNHRELENADARAEGKNPNCGDRVIVWLKLDGDTVADVTFKVPQGEGCAISRASASLMTTAVKGKPVAEVEALFERFIGQLTSQRNGRTPEPGAELGPLEVFSGVSRFAQRVRCATMAWHALHSALREASAGASDAPDTSGPAGASGV